MSDRLRSLGRESNLVAVLDRLAAAGPRSRRVLGRELSLSPASVSRLAEALLSAGLVEEVGKVGSGRGRPHTLLSVDEEAAVLVGVSVRSVSVRLRLASLTGRPVHDMRVDRVQGAAADLVAQLRSLVAEAAGAHAPGTPIAAVAVGISGAWDARARRVLAAPNLPGLEGEDLEAALREGLGDLVVGGLVVLDNDINLAALGEQACGAARGVADFYYVSLGSGVGGAAVLDGRLRRGSHGLTGELGFLPLGPAGASVPLESVVGRRCLERWVVERRGPRVGDGRAAHEDVDVFALLEDGDEELCEHVAKHVAIALAGVVVAVDPELIVLGGGIGRQSETWSARVRRHLAALVPVVPEVVPTRVGRDAALVGAVAHAGELGRANMVAHRLGRA